MRLKKAIVTILVFIALGGILGFFFQRGHLLPFAGPDGVRWVDSPITLEPAVYQQSEPILERDVASITLNLRNHSERKLKVKSINPSCSCMTVTLPEGAGAMPSLGPGETLPLSVRVDTAYRYGKRAFSVLVECEVDGQKVAELLKSEIQLDVKPGSRVYPTLLHAYELSPGNRIERSVDVFDGYPDPGIEFAKVITSDPQRLHAKLIRQTTGTAPKLEYDFRQRYSLKITYTVPEFADWHEESIKLIPADPKYPPLVIPLVLRRTPEAFSISPRAIIAEVPFEGMQSIRRILACVSTGKSPPDLVVVSNPPHTSVTLSKNRDGQPQLAVVISLPPKVIGLDDVINLTDRSSPMTSVKIPVKVYRTPVAVNPHND